MAACTNVPERPPVSPSVETGLNKSIEEVETSDSLDVLPFLVKPRREEALRINASKGRVHRKGMSLRLRLANGKHLLLKDVLEPEGDTKVHFYDQYYLNQGCYLVQYDLYEGGGYLLVRESDGKLIELASAPILSPDATRFLIASQDLTAGYVPNVVEIWHFLPHELHKEYGETQESWGPANAQWLDSVTVQFDKQEWVQAADSSSAVQTTATLLLRKTASGQWEIEPSH